MRPAVVILAITALSFLCPHALAASPDQTVVEKYDSGQVKAKYSADAAGVKNGLCQEFSEDGKLTARLLYRDGKLSGVCQRYDSGKLVVEETYVAGLLVFPRSQKAITSELEAIDSMAVRCQSATTRPGSSQEAPAAGEKPSTLAATPAQANAMRTLLKARYLCFVPYKDLVLDDEYNKRARPPPTSTRRSTR